jgi:hypothetical protein
MHNLGDPACSDNAARSILKFHLLPDIHSPAAANGQRHYVLDDSGQLARIRTSRGGFSTAGAPESLRSAIIRGSVAISTYNPATIFIFSKQ